MQEHKKGSVKNNNDEKKDIVDYDELLTAAGEFGPYQVFLFFTTFPFYIFGAFSYFQQVFITETSPNHWCMIPELENLTEYQRISLAIPVDNTSEFGYSKCLAYEANWSEVISNGITANETWKTVPCQHGWEFNKSEIPYPTIGSEMGWVCSKSSYKATAQSVFFLGSIVGGLLIGWVADRYGRIPAAVCSNLVGAIAGTASIFVNNFLQFNVCRFVMGMSYDNCMMMTYLLVLEYVAPKYRTLITNLSFAMFFTCGQVLMPWIALACDHWKIAALAFSLPMALALLAPLIIPESPRWLLSKGRVDEAIEKVLKIAHVNKKVVSTSLIDRFKNTCLKKNEVSGNLIDMLKRPLLTRMLICICLKYMICMIIFDVLIRTISQLKYNFFVAFSVIAFTELPSLMLLSFILDYTGRKLLMILTLFVCGIFCFMIPFVGDGLPSVLCAVAARFAVNMSCNTAMQWTAELLPTSTRGSGSSLVHICGYVGTVISPFVAYLDIYTYWLPMIVVGCVALFGVVLACLLPETAKKDMPQTFDEAEELITSQSLFCVKNKKANVNIQGATNDCFELS